MHWPFGVECIQRCRRASGGVDVRVDIAIGGVGWCGAQDAANFRQWDMSTYEPRRGRVAQIVKAHILETGGAANRIEASFHIVADTENEIVRSLWRFCCDRFQFFGQPRGEANRSVS